MILRYATLTQHPTVFLSLTGLRVPEFDSLVADLVPAYQAYAAARLRRPGRRRAIGAGHPYTLDARDRLLLTVVWLRQYLTYEVLGYLFGVSDTTALRTVEHWLPLLEAAGRDTMRLPDPGRGHRRGLDALLTDVPAVSILIDTFEQAVQRPQRRVEADGYYSGKKKQHTLKSQVSVDAQEGRIVDVAASVPGPTADLRLLQSSGLLRRLPAAVGVSGDLAYVGLAHLHPQGLGCTPRRKPRGQPRPPDDHAYNTAFARYRVTAEHTMGRLRCYQALAQRDRHHRRQHTARVCAVAGLANRQLAHRFPLL
jgi:hypothetical protein